jgi:biotin carboxylase
VIKLAIVGANEFQKRLVLKAREMNIETHVFAWEEGAAAKEAADFFYPISIIDKEEILQKISEIGVTGICSIASDLAMITVNYVANKLNLVGNSIECTVVTTNKFEMRKKLQEHSISIPDYQLVKDFTDIDFSKIIYPVVIKPIDRSGSRGVCKVMNKQELKLALIEAKQVSFRMQY